MAGLVGIFVLILVWVLGYQLELAQSLRRGGKRQRRSSVVWRWKKRWPTHWPPGV